MDGIIVTAEIDCRCHNPSTVILSDGKYYCNKCRSQIEYVIRGERKTSNGLFRKSILLAVDDISDLLSDRLLKTTGENSDRSGKESKYPGDEKKILSDDRNVSQDISSKKKEGRNNYVSEATGTIRFGDEVLRM